jgi:outer membrane protein OmpA-like peptidoglycan-associated protein
MMGSVGIGGRPRWITSPWLLPAVLVGCPAAPAQRATPEPVPTVNVPGTSAANVAETDPDGDGVVGAADRCPGEKEDRDYFQDEDGCPDNDNDGDGFPDEIDRCPDERETCNGYADEDGCPDDVPFIVSGRRVVHTDLQVNDEVVFEPGSARIPDEFRRLLELVAETMLTNPQILLVEVQGHDDGQRSERRARRLSGERAEAVVERLVELGVAPERLLAAGYGARCPFGPGDDEEARRANRRVEFLILVTDSGPTAVRRSCGAAVDLQPPIPLPLLPSPTLPGPALAVDALRGMLDEQPSSGRCGAVPSPDDPALDGLADEMAYPLAEAAPTGCTPRITTVVPVDLGDDGAFELLVGGRLDGPECVPGPNICASTRFAWYLLFWPDPHSTPGYFLLTSLGIDAVDAGLEPCSDWEWLDVDDDGAEEAVVRTTARWQDSSLERLVVFGARGGWPFDLGDIQISETQPGWYRREVDGRWMEREDGEGLAYLQHVEECSNDGVGAPDCTERWQRVFLGQYHFEVRDMPEAPAPSD